MWLLNFIRAAFACLLKGHGRSCGREQRREMPYESISSADSGSGKLAFMIAGCGLT